MRRDAGVTRRVDTSALKSRGCASARRATALRASRDVARAAGESRSSSRRLLGGASASAALSAAVRLRIRAATPRDALCAARARVHGALLRRSSVRAPRRQGRSCLSRAALSRAGVAPQSRAHPRGAAVSRRCAAPLRRRRWDGVRRAAAVARPDLLHNRALVDRIHGRSGALQRRSAATVLAGGCGCFPQAKLRERDTRLSSLHWLR